MMREGSKVAYTGPEIDGHQVGDEGRVIAVDANVCNVIWTSGTLVHQITPHYASSLVSATAALGSDIEDSLEVGGLVTFSVRSSYDAGGSLQVVAEMAEQGHLASFGDIAEEALSLVAARVRQDPSFRIVASDLDDEEAEDVVRQASASIIREAFGATDE